MSSISFFNQQNERGGRCPRRARTTCVCGARFAIARGTNYSQRKRRNCPLAQMTCDASLCPNAADYYSKVPNALAALEQQPMSTRAAIESVAAAHDVCPFELSLDSAATADVIVADYNYVFDPTVRLQRFIHQDQQSLLIDEAHQLSHRVRDMLSVTISSGQIQQAMAASAPEMGEIAGCP